MIMISCQALDYFVWILVAFWPFKSNNILTMVVSKCQDGVQASRIHFYGYHEADRECVYMCECVNRHIACVCMLLTIQEDDQLKLKPNYS